MDVGYEVIIECTLDLFLFALQVFYAPHIVRLSSIAGAKIEPLRYTLAGSQISSNVYYDSPIFGRGWLNASGEDI